ncbi:MULTISPECIES: copper chaperone PCu(A)C [unclassified Streptomyces]|uniref:copper chaperone PCu(A)C n=1 Tax=unclassified Streptomyces TaxID=2593676 RepID=UPI000CD5C65E|nr:MULTISPECIES: copper chaperone PCu(A)C [unclassified Streptomyces]
MSVAEPAPETGARPSAEPAAAAPPPWRSAARAGLPPLAAGLLTLACLTAWAAAGKAGSPAEVTVGQGTVFLPVLDTQPTTGVFFDIGNTGGSDDELLAVRTECGEAMFADRELTRGAGRMIMIPRITVAAGTTLEMSPFTPNVMLSVNRPLTNGERVDFVLTFRQAGEVPATAVVVPPSS